MLHLSTYSPCRAPHDAPFQGTSETVEAHLVGALDDPARDSKLGQALAGRLLGVALSAAVYHLYRTAW